MPAISASLSCEPKCAIANSLTGMGVKLIAVSPTAMTGALSGPISAAASSATPSATAAARIPASAAAAVLAIALTTERDGSCRSCVLIMAAIRSCPRTGLADVSFAQVPAVRGNPEADLPRMEGMRRTEIRQLPPDRGAAEEGAGRDPDLAVVLARVARGDHQAFDLVYGELAGPVYGVVRQVLRDPAQSEEIAQEVLLEIWRTASRFDPARGSAAAWALTIAHRRAVDRVRSGTPARAASRRWRRTCPGRTTTWPRWSRPGWTSSGSAAASAA